MTHGNHITYKKPEFVDVFCNITKYTESALLKILRNFELIVIKKRIVQVLDKFLFFKKYCTIVTGTTFGLIHYF